MHYVIKNIFTGEYAGTHGIQGPHYDWRPIEWCSDINKARLYRSEEGAKRRIRYSSDSLSHPPWTPKHIKIIPVTIRERK